MKKKKVPLIFGKARFNTVKQNKKKKKEKIKCLKKHEAKRYVVKEAYDNYALQDLIALNFGKIFKKLNKQFINSRTNKAEVYELTMSIKERIYIKKEDK